MTEAGAAAGPDLLVRGASHLWTGRSGAAMRAARRSAASPSK